MDEKNERYLILDENAMDRQTLIDLLRYYSVNESALRLAWRDGYALHIANYKDTEAAFAAYLDKSKVFHDRFFFVDLCGFSFQHRIVIERVKDLILNYLPIRKHGVTEISCEYYPKDLALLERIG